MKWIRTALGLCHHKWSTYQTFNVTDSISGAGRGQILLRYCEHCNAIKQVRVK